MPDYPTLTAHDLSAFSGRDVASYPAAYSVTALAQARLFFKFATCLATLPDDADKQELAKNAILDFADYIVLSQQYAEDAASPFTSETIGSYSYSRSANAIKNGEKTGRFWFDLAVEMIGVCQEIDDVSDFGGLELFEHDIPMVTTETDGNIRVLGPKDSAELINYYGSTTYGQSIISES